MMHPYITFADGTEVVHSDIKMRDGVETVLVHFERPCDDGFKSARCELPTYTWTPWEGHFTSDELESFNRFLEANAHLIYRYARGGMALVA